MKKRELILRNVWLTIQRSGKDARARKIVLRMGLITLYYAGYVMLMRREVKETGPWGFVFYMILSVLALGVVYFMRRNHTREDASVFSLSTPEPVIPVDDLSAHRRRIADTLLHLAVMVDRAGTEALHHQSKMDPEQTGASRRRTLDIAMNPELWETLPPADQELLRSAEGSWNWEQVWPWVVRSEDVRVLRWVLGLDQVLVPFEFLRGDLTTAIELTLNPARVNGTTCLASYDLRPQQTAAQTMIARCISEGVRRGELNEPDPEARVYYLGLAERLATGESEDLLTGPETVAKSSWERIRWLGQAALRRVQVLGALIDYLNGPADGSLVIPRVDREAEPMPSFP